MNLDRSFFSPEPARSFQSANLAMINGAWSSLLPNNPPADGASNAENAIVPQSSKALTLSSHGTHTSASLGAVSPPIDANRLIRGFRTGDRKFDAGNEILGIGSTTGSLFNLLDGWIAVYSLLPDGRRQIVHFAFRIARRSAGGALVRSHALKRRRAGPDGRSRFRRSDVRSEIAPAGRPGNRLETRAICSARTRSCLRSPDEYRASLGTRARRPSPAGAVHAISGAMARQPHRRDGASPNSRTDRRCDGPDIRSCQPCPQFPAEGGNRSISIPASSNPQSG